MTMCSGAVSATGRPSRMSRGLVTSFRADQIELLKTSGWVTCQSIADAVANAGLPAVTSCYLETTFTADQWDAADAAVTSLRDHFGAARFADEVTYGLVMVPDPNRLDTRGPVDPEARRDQFGVAGPDVVDERLPEGRLGVRGPAWTLVATVTGRYGIALGSYLDVAGADAQSFIVNGVDTRDLMTRQVWGARVLQSGPDLPDSELNDRWTFTLFPGECLTEGMAASGTVLKGKVRFRLGKADRGIGSARTAPAIAIA